MTNSRRKGQTGELEFIRRHLLEHWPQARRNLDQYSEDKRDCVRAGGVHWQIKRTERLALWSAIRQAETEAIGADLPVVAFRRNRSGWYCVISASELVALLRLRES